MTDAMNASELYHDRQWWNAHLTDEKPHPLLWNLFDEITSSQQILKTNTQRLMSIYQWGYRADGFAGSMDETEMGLDETRNSYNYAQNVVHTVWAKVIKSQILPMALTTGGSYLERQRAKEFTEAVEGEFAENDWEKIKEDMVLDSQVTYHGAGAAYIFNDGRKVKIEHCPIEDVWFDEAETRYRMPRSCFREYSCDRFALLAIYGKEDPKFYGTAAERRQAILKEVKAEKRRTGAATHSDQVAVLQAWHLPSVSGDELEQTDGEDGDDESSDGRYVVSIRSMALESTPWQRDHFPILLYVPRPRRRSIWGLSLMFDLVPPQREYEILCERFQRAHLSVGYAQIYASRQANVNARDLDNQIGVVFEGDGPTPPSPFVYDPIPQSAYQYKNSIPMEMLNSRGISQMAAQGQVPAGLAQASGKALETFIDEDSEHLLPEYRALERLTVDAAWLIAEEWRSLVQNDNGYSVRYRSKKYLKKIAVRDILMDKENCVIRCFPVSALSKSPSGKLAQLTEMLNAGAIDVTQFKRLYNIPDLESENEIDAADSDVIDASLDAMVTSGKYISPENFDNLALAKERAGKFYNMLRKNNILSASELGDGYLPDDRMKLVRDYLEDIETITTQMAEAAAPPPAPPGMPPMGGPPPMNGMPPGVAPPDMGMGAPPPAMAA